MQTIVIASNNSGKIHELRHILGGMFEVVSASDVGILDDIEENGETFEDNASIKARYIFDRTGLATIADDSGLCVNALGGEPSIRSARYVADHDNDANIRAVLDNMRMHSDRSAIFVCAICYVDTLGNAHIFRGETVGDITTERIGSGGFGYDSIFMSRDLGLTFAQATMEQKHTVGHRGRAIRQLVELLKNN